MAKCPYWLNFYISNKRNISIGDETLYITNTAANTHKIEMNSKEYQAFSELFSRLIFNPDGVSNQFRLENDKVKVVKSMSLQVYANNRPKSIY
jgi:hypothetical protein